MYKFCCLIWHDSSEVMRAQSRLHIGQTPSRMSCQGSIPVQKQGSKVIMFNILVNILDTKFKNNSLGLPMQQRHPQSFPGCPTPPLGSPGQFGTGSGTAGSHAHDKRSSSVSCRSAASAQVLTGASRIADKADKMKCKNKTYQSRFDITAATRAYL